MYRLAAEKSTLITQSLTDEAPENTTVDNEQHSSTSSQDQQLSPIDSLLGTVEAEFSASDDEESPASSASSSKLAAFSLLGIGILIGAGFILKPHLKVSSA